MEYALPSTTTSPDTPSKAIRLISRRSFHVGDTTTVSGRAENVDPNNNYNNSYSEGEFFSTSLSNTRRRFSTTTMDPSSAMHRLRISMVGHAGDSTVDDPMDDSIGASTRAPLVPNLSPGDLTDAAAVHRDGSRNQETNLSNGRVSHSTLFSDGWMIRAFRQVPAILLIGIFHLMIGVPFGVSYFPMQWTSRSSSGPDESSPIELDGDLPEGEFPIPGKEAFGIRLFLFSTMVGQVVFTFFSGFPNPIGLQMVENIGFTKELAAVAISHQGYGVDALATLMVMFGIASVLVGVVFFLLGKFKLGKIVYFFPTHVLIGLIGGIGVLLCKTGIEVTIAEAISFSALAHSWKLWIVIVGLELFLRFLEWITGDSKGKPRFALLSPVFFCMITPLFYLAVWTFRVPISAAEEVGYFFPPMVQDQEAGVGSDFGTPWDVWKVRLPSDSPETM